MALFAIADLHLSLGADKPMDVFPGWENYVGRLQENWRKTVGPEDTVILAGDFSWAMNLKEATPDFAFLHTLPGRKLLLKGNHDYWWNTKTKIDACFQENGFSDMALLHNNAYAVGDIAVCGSRGWLYNAESAEDRKIVARECGRLEASIAAARKTGKRPVAFLHYPPVYDGAECREILQVLERNEIRDCYFGHIHGAAAARRAALRMWGTVRLHLISGDHVGFTPVLVADPEETG